MKSSIRSTTELARLLGLSRWTVSRALNGHPGLQAGTVKKITETARRHGFAPSLLGRGLRTGRTNLVGVCLPDLVDYFLTTKITFLQRALQQHGLQPLLQITDGTKENETAVLERFASLRCAGVVLIASRLDDRSPGLRCLAAAGIPLVHVDPLHSAGRSAVSTDRRSAMVQAVMHLHHLGHRRLVAAGFSRTDSYGLQRIAGLQAVCRKLGWNFRRDIHLLEHPGTAGDLPAGEALAGAYLKAAHKIPAILAINDRVALGLMRGLQTRGLDVPRDVSVIGYDNADFSPYASPALTTIDPQGELLIGQAVALLLSECLPGGPGEGKTLRIKPKLVPRASDGPPPARSKRKIMQRNNFLINKPAASGEDRRAQF